MSSIKKLSFLHEKYTYHHLVDTVSKVIFLKVETMGTLQYVHVSRLLLQNESSTGEPKVDTYIKYGSCLATTTCYFSKNCLFKLWMYVSVYDKSDLEITLCNYLVNCIFRWNFWTSLKDMFVHTFERQSKWFAFEILSRKKNLISSIFALQYNTYTNLKKNCTEARNWKLFWRSLSVSM